MSTLGTKDSKCTVPMVDQIFFVFSKEDDEFNATWHDSRPLPMIELENEW